MKYTIPVRRAMIVLGACAIAGAPTAIAEPLPSTSTETSAVETSAVETSTSAPSTSAGIGPTTSAPSTTAASSTTAAPSSTTSTAPSVTPTGLADSGELRVDTGAFVVTGPVQAGAVVPGVMEVTVTDTRRDRAGWTADVRATAMHGTDGNTVSPGQDSFYRAQSTPCSESAGSVPLREDAVVVASASAACPAATWTADVGIAVPVEAGPDTYSLTITHSVY